MGSIPLPALQAGRGQEQQPNILSQLAQIMQLKNAKQQGQIGEQQLQGEQLQNQQRETDAASQKAVMKAYQEAEGNLDKTIPLAAKYGAKPETLIALKQKSLEQQNAILTSLKAKGEKAISDSDLLQGWHDQLAKLDPQTRAAQYLPSLQQLQSAGVDVSQAPQQYPGDQQFDMMGLGIKGHNSLQAEIAKQASLEKTKAETTKATADSQKAQAEADNLKKFGRTEKPQPTEASLAVAAAGGDQSAKDALAVLAEQKKAGRTINVNKSEVDDAINVAAQSLANGELTRLKDIASLRGDQRLLVFSRAKKLNPNFNTADIDRKIKMEDAFTNGKDGQNLQSFGTFLEHGGEASDVVNSIRQGNTPMINKSINWWRKNASGDPRYQQLVSALEPVRKEFEGFLLGGRALYGEDRKAAETILSEDSSPAQIQGALKQMGHTVKARYNEANFRYKRVMGKDLQDAVSPEAMTGAQKIGVDLGISNSQGGSSLDQFWKK